MDILMCKDAPVYHIQTRAVINAALLPGAMRRGAMDFWAWMQTRYCVRSNVAARRLMMRAFGTDTDIHAVLKTRALSLSDCYWLKGEDERVAFDAITPYKNEEWQGEGRYEGGSVATLFVNGASSKRWINRGALVKYGAEKEYAVYQFAAALGVTDMAKARLVGRDLQVENFTSPALMLETMAQSAYVGDGDNHLAVAVDLWGERAVRLLALDYLVEHDDRHSGNIGFFRDTDTGEALHMAPFWDFDWAWSDGVVQLPDAAYARHGALIRDLCEKALAVSGVLPAPYGGIIQRRAKELGGNCGG